jgi:acyl-coenzyme A synthetase/AMP-(fatty) acid ligase
MAWMQLAELLARERHGAIYAHGPALPHHAFARRALSVAGALHDRGVRNAGLWFEDAAQLAIALFACWRAGVTAMLAGDARHASCAAIEARADLWLTDQPALPVPARRSHALDDLDGSAPPLAPRVLDMREGGVVLCTSGSSGRPKHICKQWSQLAAEVDALEQRWRWSETPACVLGSVSAQHMYGLPFRVLWPLAAGRAMDRAQLAFPEALQQASLAHRSFVWIASPALLKRLGAGLDWDALGSGIRQIFSAGGPLPHAVSDMLAARLGCRPIEIYGSSETGAVAWRQGADAWRPLPGAATGIEDGRLWVRSNWLEGDGRFRTDDAATPAGAGFHLRGRLDRIVKIEEKRISLPALEQRLMAHSYVREAHLGVAGTPRLTALVALAGPGIHALRNGGRKAVIDSLRAHMAGSVEPLGVPRHWRLMRELPWNAQGKLPQDIFTAAARRPRSPDARVELCATSPDGVRESRLHMEVPLDLVHFNGHFPGMPVVPGVAQIEWVMDLARRHLSADLDFLGMEALKFQRLARPGDPLALTLAWHPARGKLYFEFRSADQPCSSGRILTGAPGRQAAIPDADAGRGIPPVSAT